MMLATVFQGLKNDGWAAKTYSVGKKIHSIYFENPIPTVPQYQCCQIC